MKEKTIDWLKVAETDIQVAEILIDHEHLASGIAFHCQQAIEKSLKAILEENDAEVPKIHRLITLIELVKKWYQPTLDLRIILSLDKLYIDSRYPGDFGLLPDGMPTKDEIHEIVQATRAFYLDVKEFLT